MISLFGVRLVERLRPDLEPQVFHCLENVVVALEKMYVEVAESVVAFLIIHPQ